MKIEKGVVCCIVQVVEESYFEKFRIGTVQSLFVLYVKHSNNLILHSILEMFTTSSVKTQTNDESGERERNCTLA